MTKPKNKYKRFFTIISMLFLLHQLVAAQSNFWIQVDQLLGGNVKSFTFNKNNNIITGVKSRGIFKSADAGKTWLPAGLQNISISVMKINSSNEIFYAGTESDGLYYSKDNGDSWQLINSDLSSYFINCIEFDQNNRLVIGTNKGLFICDGEGKNLTQYTVGIGNDEIRSIKIVSNNNILIAGATGIYRSFGDYTFQPLTNGLTDNNSYSIYLSVSGTILAGTNGGLFRLKNDYSGWIKLDTNSVLGNIRSVFTINDSKIFAGTTSAIYLSPDSGKTFQKTFSDSTQINMISVDKNSVIYASTEKGLYTYISGNWVKTGVSQDVFVNQIISDNIQSIYSASTEGVFKANNEGKSWESITSGLGIISVTTISKDSLGYIFFGSTSGVYRSSNEGKNWVKANAGLLNFNINTIFSLGNIQLCGTQNGLFRSTDNGGSWRQIISIPTNAAVNTLIKTNQNNILAGTSTGIYSSTDNGFSWTAKNEGLSISDIYYLDKNKSGTIICGNFSTIFESTDDGNTWNLLSSNFSTGSIKCMMINPIGELYLGTNAGVFRSINNGVSWLQINSGLLNIDVRTLKLSDAGYIFAGTNGGGIFRSDLLAPEVPVLLYPLNKSTNVEKNLVLKWSASSGSLLYRFQVSLLSDFSTIAYEDISTSTSQSLIGLNDYAKYYWRVNASNGVGESRWSDVWEFTTLMSPPQPPIPIYPMYNEVIGTYSPILKWNPSDKTDFYELQVSEKADFSTVLSYFTYIYNTKQIIGDLKEDTYYYWKIRANNLGGFGNWSSVWIFKTARKLPYIPLPVYPVNLSTVKIDQSVPELTLEWNKVVNANSYSLIVSNNQIFSSIVLNESGIVDTSFSTSSIASGIYFWKVKAKNSYGESDWSPVFTFSSLLTGVKEIKEISDYKLLQNYPNPFNPETNISFTLPKYDFVIVRILDSYGREVATLTENYYKPGKYSIKFKPVGIASGVYYYQILTSSYSQTNKMLYLR